MDNFSPAIDMASRKGWRAVRIRGSLLLVWRLDPRLLGCLAACLVWAPEASAGVADFLATCLADGTTFDRLPARLAAQGWIERDPQDGAQGPALAVQAERRRLWALPGWNGGIGDAFVGLVSATADRPMEMCWHASRPGDSGAEALSELRRRFPPAGPAERGTEYFHGGFERWPIDLAGQTVFLSVSWPLLQQPEQGSSILAVLRLRAPVGSR